MKSAGFVRIDEEIAAEFRASSQVVSARPEVLIRLVFTRIVDVRGRQCELDSVDWVKLENALVKLRRLYEYLGICAFELCGCFDCVYLFFEFVLQILNLFFDLFSLFY